MGVIFSKDNLIYEEEKDLWRGREYPKIKQKKTWRNECTIMMLCSVQAVEAGLCFLIK
jgi:hypothetical protein